MRESPKEDLQSGWNEKYFYVKVTRTCYLHYMSVLKQNTKGEDKSQAEEFPDQLIKEFMVDTIKFTVNKFHVRLHLALVSHDCCNKLTQTGWFKTT